MKQIKTFIINLIFILTLISAPIQAMKNNTSTNEPNNSVVMIIDLASLEENCSIAVKNNWVLNPGTYVIPSDIEETISIETKTLIVGESTTLIIGADETHVDTLLIADTVVVKDSGIMNISGGKFNYDKTSLSYDSLKVNYFIQEGGELTIIGGEDYSTHGINVSKTFTQQGGKITSSGGSGVNSQGIYTSKFIQEDGILIAQGGTSLLAYGICVASKFTQEGGEIISTGGSGEYADGMGLCFFTQNGGMLTANGGKGDTSIGVSVWNDCRLNAGTLIANGGEGYYSVGLSYAYLFKHENYGPIITNIGEGDKAYGFGKYYGNQVQPHQELDFDPRRTF